MSDIQCSTCSTGISLLQPAVPPSVGSYSTSTLHLQCVIQFHSDLGLADHEGSVLHLILTRVCRSH